MVTGFTDIQKFDMIVGLELYQVTLDKYHVIFYFENGHILLNVASAFSHHSRDQSVSYTYDIYQDQKQFRVYRILRTKVKGVSIYSRNRLVLLFENDDELVIHDNPESCSWWFMPVNAADEDNWYIGDEEDLVDL